MSADPTTFPRSSTAPSSDNDNVDASPGSNQSNGSNSPVLNRVKWKKILRMQSSDEDRSDGSNDYQPEREKWSFGVLNDKETDEVPGTVILLSSNRNEPLGLRQQPARTSASSFPSPYPPSRASSRSHVPQMKRTADGSIVLDPQPDDSLNDPLNWPSWRRDLSLLSLGFYSMLGGGMTPILAAAYNDVSETFGITSHQVALTTGLYMLGLGLGSVVMSPTAILYGKRPIYLLGSALFIVSAVWCAVSPNFVSLLLARIFQGVAVSPVECLPSATIAEIFFLHERAYRVGIYTLLLLGGKNLVPLVSAAITQSLGWRWVFWIVAITTGFGLILVFFFVPESFWDRTPRRRQKRPVPRRSLSDLLMPGRRGLATNSVTPAVEKDQNAMLSPEALSKRKDAHVGFSEVPLGNKREDELNEKSSRNSCEQTSRENGNRREGSYSQLTVPAAPDDQTSAQNKPKPQEKTSDIEAARPVPRRDTSTTSAASFASSLPPIHPYTRNLQTSPPLGFYHSLQLFHGRLSQDKWLRVLVRPFILFAYPAVLWSAMVYALSVGWLIVLSEAVAEIFRDRDTYNFSALGTGLIYISPFVGGIVGTVVAGKFSDIVVRFMTRRNGGIYEPEFRLVMAVPITLTTAMGLMGFGWSAQERDRWIVPTVFFGILSFGCSVGSTTAITFCVDSYRQYAGEALVTLNFSKNVLHGFIFSLFFVQWLKSDGARDVFVCLGGIHIACMLSSIPLYIYGKRARMWTVRRRLMEKF
ncbi:MFS transporter [Histoplasma capsulatum var. duboisii H88]|uniref:MFS transporter n=1 Tax=Ajellomyces capsulatus (strain H88) TaxID=544711 RepID=F0U869_AJEC8|nr:MFS transporter [Histoplasma capsulatum var. duboisii H88]QSS51892.1 MFS transporter [Histoplasma capsulatum var. duboisii H88]